jgi:hypothetical protein
MFLVIWGAHKAVWNLDQQPPGVKPAAGTLFNTHLRHVAAHQSCPFVAYWSENVERAQGYAGT